MIKIQIQYHLSDGPAYLLTEIILHLRSLLLHLQLSKTVLQNARSISSKKMKMTFSS